jgi:hypothetical protein
MSKFRVGQVVHCVVFGEGIVVSVDHPAPYPIAVNFDNGKKLYYTKDGRMFLETNVCLYHSKPEIIVPEWHPRQGEWCLFSDNHHHVCCVAKFSGKMDDGRYRGGFQSWDNCTPLSPELVELLSKECEQ